MCVILIYTIYIFIMPLMDSYFSEIAKNGAQWLCLVGQMILRRFLVRTDVFFLFVSQTFLLDALAGRVCDMCSSKFVSSTHLCLCHANLVCHCWFAMHLHHLCVCVYLCNQSAVRQTRHDVIFHLLFGTYTAHACIFPY